MSPSSLVYVKGTVCVPKIIPKRAKSATLVQSIGGTPFKNFKRIVDFTEIPQARRC
jgi:hypothetical protein